SESHRVETSHQPTSRGLRRPIRGLLVNQAPLRCWQFRLKEPRIRTPSPMLGQAMFICVPSALWQWN
ncbi:hypothetical protein, partial [Corynebacterium diphtheriae]|uniref:hypothetical protein n=1 Tax=Corynebacterium diphtheriae TaxID=1717 RepID=UPI001A7E0CD1